MTPFLMLAPTPEGSNSTRAGLAESGPCSRLFAPFCTQKPVRFEFVFSSFLRTTKSNILCFQQILKFVPTIFNIFPAKPLLPGSWHPHFPVPAFGRLLRRTTASPVFPTQELKSLSPRDRVVDDDSFQPSPLGLSVSQIFGWTRMVPRIPEGDS